MSIAVTCVACGTSLKLREEFAGKRGKCPKCQGAIIVPELAAASPAVAVSKTAPPTAPKPAAAQAAAAPTPPAELAAQVLGAFQGKIAPVAIPLTYRLGILVAAIVMVVLPLIYVALIALVGYGMYWHAVSNTGILGSVKGGRAQFMALVVYLAPLAVGGILVGFMFKPLLSRPASDRRIRSLTRNGEPLLFDFIEKICDAVGAPRPKRIDLDLQVNASASFRRGWLSFLGSDLVLTIGLPLVAGFNTRQFAGVMAHEFGHFTQGAGMRLSYVVRTISHWFTRVVYERDQWDERLQVWAQSTDIRLGWVLYLSMIMVWLTRKVLWALMMVGHLVAGYLLRQMEFEADRYEARLAGSQTFAATARQLIVINAANQNALNDLNEFYRDGRLADNLPKLILANIDQLPADAQKKIDALIAESKTGLFDTHPADQERIASAAREQTEGIFQLELPAAVLLSHFDAQAKAATLEFYRSVFGNQVKAEELHPVEDLLARQQRELAGQKATLRFFQGTLNLLRPLVLPPWEAKPPAAPKVELQQLQTLREKVRGAQRPYRERLLVYDEADTKLVEAAQAGALHRAHIKFPKTLFDGKMSNSEAAQQVRRSARAEIERLDSQLKDCELAAGERLVLALRMLYVPQVAARVADAAALQAEADELISLLRSVGSRLSQIEKLRNSNAALNILLTALQGNEQSESLISAIKLEMDASYLEIRNLQEGLEFFQFPFDHAKGKLTLAEYILAAVPAKDDLQGILQANQALLEGLSSVYLRSAGRLATIAEQVETALNLPPLPEPERAAESSGPSTS